jgi:AraC-like DNA-binding protein
VKQALFMTQSVSSRKHSENVVDFSMRFFSEDRAEPYIKAKKSPRHFKQYLVPLSSGVFFGACEYNFSKTTKLKGDIEEGPIVSFNFLLEGDAMVTSCGSKSERIYKSPGCVLESVGGSVQQHCGAGERMRHIGIFLTLEGLHRVLGNTVSILPNSWHSNRTASSSSAILPLALRPSMQMAAHTAFNTLMADDHDSRLILESKALELIVLCLRELTGQPVASEHTKDYIEPKDREMLEAAKSIVCEELADPPSLEDLARRVSTNDFKLKILFKQYFGTTVYGFIRAERMRLAKEYLMQGMPVGRTADEIGYSNYSHFARNFRKHFGIAPSSLLRRKG